MQISYEIEREQNKKSFKQFLGIMFLYIKNDKVARSTEKQRTLTESALHVQLLDCLQILFEFDLSYSFYINHV